MLLYLLGIVIILMENIIVLISFNGCYNFFFFGAAFRWIFIGN